MRLINTRTRRLEEHFLDPDEPLRYAILSHRWEDDEITYEDIHNPHVHKLRGYHKIRAACNKAAKDGFLYIWIDTCCIDKSSSSELTEAINCMYRWYKDSQKCYVYLNDVSRQLKRCLMPNEHNLWHCDFGFEESKWFTRGWTLQELIAPSHVEFYNQKWDFLGTKLSPHLSETIRNITGIDEDILKGSNVLDRSVAQRMSWAAHRTTKRVEDRAYSLMGLFDVNMPLLYGEGEKAFYRLQEEIIRQSDDHSIFAWPINWDVGSTGISGDCLADALSAFSFQQKETGLLAKSPAAFAEAGHIHAVEARRGKTAFNMTNRGLSITLDLTPWSTDTYIAALYCIKRSSSDSEDSIENCRLGIFLRRLKADDQYIRVCHGGKTFLQFDQSYWTPQRRRNARPIRRISLNVRQSLTTNSSAIIDRIYGFRICLDELFDVSEREPPKVEGRESAGFSWNPRTRVMEFKVGEADAVGYLDLSTQDTKIRCVKLGFDFDFNPVCFIAESGGLERVDPRANRGGKAAQRQFLKEQMAQWPSIHERSPFDETGWSVVHGDLASPLNQHNGIWALKGDRVHGLSVQLRDDDPPLYTKIEITRDVFEGLLVWEFSIKNLKAGKPFDTTQQEPSRMIPEDPVTGDVTKYHRGILGHLDASYDDWELSD